MGIQRWAVVAISAAILAGSHRGQSGSISAAIGRELGGPLLLAASADNWNNPELCVRQPTWVDGPVLTRAADAVALLKTAATHGLDPDNYRLATLERWVTSNTSPEPEPSTADDLARLDVQITASLLAFGRDVSVGRIDPSAINPFWKKQRTTLDLVATLNEASDLPTWFAPLPPQHPEYEALRQTLVALLAQREVASTDAIDAKIRRIAINLERWRWLPDDLGAQHLLINVPAFQLHVREGGKTVLDMRVIVGKADGFHTPLFSDEMESIVFSPYWNVPDSIATKEIAPAMRQNGSYLAQHNMQVMRPTASGMRAVDPSTINWSDSRQVRGLSVRQRPGAGNALGSVKFLFPNDFNVYLHDTSSRNLFALESRALSHGCVRVAEPRRLAEYVLRDAQQWNERTISAAMSAGVERHVKLARAIPVHIVYFTVWIGNDGALQFSPDVYGYDAKQIKLMANHPDS